MGHWLSFRCYISCCVPRRGSIHCALLTKSAVRDKVLRWGAESLGLAVKVRIRKGPPMRGNNDLDGQEVCCMRRSPPMRGNNDHNGQEVCCTRRSPPMRGNDDHNVQEVLCTRDKVLLLGATDLDGQSPSVRDKVLWWGATTTLMVKSPLHETKSSDKGQSHGDLAGQSPFVRDKVLQWGAWF